MQTKAFWFSSSYELPKSSHDGSLQAVSDGSPPYFLQRPCAWPVLFAPGQSSARGRAKIMEDPTFHGTRKKGRGEISIAVGSSDESTLIPCVYPFTHQHAEKKAPYYHPIFYRS